MGIGRGAFSQLVDCAADFSDKEGRTAMLGRQVFNLRGEMRKRGPRAAKPYDAALARRFPNLKAADLVQQDAFAERMFEKLGFGAIEAIDASDYEGAEIVLDLGKPVDPELHGQFSFIYDGGTLEHVFNLPQAFVNVLNMLRTGGRFIGVNPYNGFPSHGMYQFSPELIWTFWRHGCGCRVRVCRAINDRGYALDLPDPTAVGKRLELRLGPSWLGRMPRDRLLLAYEIEKTAEARAPEHILQSDYVSLWQDRKKDAAT